MPPKQVKDPKAQVRKLVRSGVRIGQWTIAADEPIAEGAFGVVVRVRREGDKEQSAMKIELENAYCTIMREASCMRQFDGSPGHECLARCFDEGEVEVEGIKIEYHVTPLYRYSLEALYQSKAADAPTNATVFQVAADVLTALSAIHENDYVFQDLKPANILWSGTRWTLVDFGMCMPPLQMHRYTFNGSCEFASDRAMEFGGSRLDDDLGGLIYVLAWCVLGGRLPWSSLDPAMEPRKYRELRAKHKVDLSDGVLSDFANDVKKSLRQSAFVKSDFPYDEFIARFKKAADDARRAAAPKTPVKKAVRGSAVATPASDSPALRRSSRLAEKRLALLASPARAAPSPAHHRGKAAAPRSPSPQKAKPAKRLQHSPAKVASPGSSPAQPRAAAAVKASRATRTRG